MAEIKQWTNAPEYMRAYEKARRTRLSDTGEYVVNSALYQKWNGSDIANAQLGSSMAVPAIPQMLVIKGYPPVTLSGSSHTDQESR